MAETLEYVPRKISLSLTAEDIETHRTPGKHFPEDLQKLCQLAPGQYLRDVQVVLPSSLYSAAYVDHCHDEWVIMYYAYPNGVPIVIEGKEVFPEAGEVIVLPPKTYHHVKRINRKRISWAVLKC